MESTLDIGGAALRYADTLSTGAATITPHLVADWGSGFIEASGTYSQFTSGGGWSTQGFLSASRFIPASRGFFAELGGFAGGSTHNDGTRTGEVIANGRLHLARDNSEYFLGLGGGRTWDGAAWRSLLLGEVGTSIGSGPTSALFSLSPTMVNDSIKYADAQASVSWKGETVDLGAMLGFRLGNQLTTLNANVRSWASASAVFWMTPRIGVALGGGNYPVDPTQGFPGGRFVSLSLRLAQGRRPSQLPSEQSGQESRTTDLAPNPTTAVTGFSAIRAAGKAVTLRVNAPDARSVEINGDFTNWIPAPLSPMGGGWWSTTIPIKSGKYQMNVRVDGGQWIVPPGLLSMVDEFGGTVGLLVIE
ncbi:MAG TPA: glycogen-binding domain-containing protein [Gemmatimonadaceae bacterium]